MIIKYLKYIISASSIMTVYRHYKLNIKYNSKRTVISYGVNITNSDLGVDIFIGENTQLNNSRVGNHSYFNSNCKITNATIGKFCSIGSNVTIGIGTHPTDMVSTHPSFYANNKGFKTFADKMYFQKERGIIEIGNDVWIGSDVRILNDVKIGHGSVIAIGSIVTKDVPDYAIVGGIPAKIIKYRFSTEEIKSLLKIKWWDKDSKYLEARFKDFHSTENFIQKYGTN
jgi:acetyltransferase-like isoleucine patch superfamily enzyme